MSPTTPVYALRYPASSDPADVPTDMGELATDVENKLLTAAATYSTTPPASPVDGQLWCLPVDTTKGVMWMFRYRAAASTYKWECVGGAPLISGISTQESTTTGGSWVNLGTVGPTATAPRAGDYRLDASAGATSTTALSVIQIGVGVSDFTTPTGEWISNVPTAGWYTGLSGSVAATLAANDQIRVKYRTGAGGGTFSWYNRSLAVIPIRVS